MRPRRRAKAVSPWSAGGGGARRQMQSGFGRYRKGGAGVEGPSVAVCREHAAASPRPRAPPPPAQPSANAACTAPGGRSCSPAPRRSPGEEGAERWGGLWRGGTATSSLPISCPRLAVRNRRRQIQGFTNFCLVALRFLRGCSKVRRFGCTPASRQLGNCISNAPSRGGSGAGRVSGSVPPGPFPPPVPGRAPAPLRAPKEGTGRRRGGGARPEGCSGVGLRLGLQVKRDFLLHIRSFLLSSSASSAFWCCSIQNDNFKSEPQRKHCEEGILKKLCCKAKMNVQIP